MLDLLVNLELTIECPSCGDKIAKNLGWLQNHNQLRCSRCGTGITLAGDELAELRKMVEQLDVQLSRLKGSIGSAP